MKDSKDEENVVGLIVASASTGVLAILAVAAVIVCCKHHSDSGEEERWESDRSGETHLMTAVAAGMLGTTRHAMEM